MSQGFSLGLVGVVLFSWQNSISPYMVVDKNVHHG